MPGKGLDTPLGRLVSPWVWVTAGRLQKHLVWVRAHTSAPPVIGLHGVPQTERLLFLAPMSASVQSEPKRW